MLLGGLWHGAAWTFLLWGGIHGVWLALHRAFSQLAGKGRTSKAGRVRKVLSMLGTFHLVCLAWVFFRSESLDQACALIRRLGFGWETTGFVTTGVSLIVFFVGPLVLYEAWCERRRNSFAVLEQSWLFRTAIYLYIILMLLFFSAPAPVEFLYFQF